MDRDFLISAAATDKAFVIGMLKHEIAENSRKLMSARRSYCPYAIGGFENRARELKDILKEIEGR
jgi:hypothetical protein